MASLRRWLVSGVAVIGCGPVVATPGAEGSGSSSDDATTDVDDGGTGSASTVMPGDTSADSGDASDDDDAGTTGTSEPGRCTTDSPDGPVAVLADSDSAAILRADGSTIALEVPPEPHGEAFASGADAAGDFVVLATGVGGLVDGEFRYSGALSLFDRDGALVWRVATDDLQMSSPHVADDGSVVVSRSDLNGAVDVAIVVDGEIVRTTAGFYPDGAAAPSGDVLGRGDDGTRPGWWRASDDALVPVASTPLPGSVVRDGDGYVYLAQDGDAPVLVHEGLDGQVVTPLPDLTGVADLRVEGGASTHWFVVSVLDELGEPSDWWRIDAESGEVLAFELTPPGDRVPLDCYWPLAGVDGEGRVFRGTRDASTAWMSRRDPAAAAWTDVGLALTEVDAINVAVFGDTLMLRADAAGQTFCPFQEYEPDRDALAGSSTQLLFPASPEPVVIPPTQWPSIRMDGTCALVLGTDAAGTPAGSLVDLDTNDALELSSDAVAQGNVLAWWDG